MFFRKIYKFAGEKCIAMKRGIHIMLVFFLLVVSCPLPLWPGMQNTRLYQEEVNCAFTNAVCQDADGFVWMGTDYGLYRLILNVTCMMSPIRHLCRTIWCVAFIWIGAVVCGSGRPTACNIIVPNQTISGLCLSMGYPVSVGSSRASPKDGRRVRYGSLLLESGCSVSRGMRRCR